MASKTGTKPKSVAKSALSTAKEKPAVAKKPATPKQAGQVKSDMVRRKDMVERIAVNSGLRPNAIKTVLDAVLSELGKALSAGEGLNLEPLGKVKVTRRIDQGNAEVLVCKIRRKLPVADAPKVLDTATE